MRVLIVMRHSGYLRNFESTVRLLCDRGHKVELAFQHAGTHWLLDSSDVAQQLVDAYPRFTRSVIPERTDSWGTAARELRLSLDYLRYLEPEYRDAPKLRERAMRDVPPGLVAWTGRGIGATGAGRRWLASGLRALHRAVPSDPRIDAFIDARRPDLLVVTPLIQPGATQAEYVRSARALGIPTALCVASWDNLTNKGLIHGPVDLVTVWNEMMKREAVELHGVPPERVVVTGAQPFDHWFTWQPATDRAAFCARVGLASDQPYFLYLCSSRFVAPDEAPFVRQWVRQLRSSSSPALQQVGVLVRPHPQHADQWRNADLRDLGSVAVWPPGGAAPSDDDKRAEYFDSIHHSAAVVGLNTTAEIESAIIGRPVYTVLAPEFRDTQEGTLHFHHLRDVSGGLLHVAHTPAEHLDQLDGALRDGGAADERCRRFVAAFVRPFGLDVAATPKLVAALERLTKSAAAEPVRTPFWAPLVQPALARRGERRQREQHRLNDIKAIRAAGRQRRSPEIAAQARAHAFLEIVDALSWKRVVAAYLALNYHDRIRFGKETLSEMPGELAQANIKRERLDYPRADIYLRITTKAERHRLHACAKEPFTVQWLEEYVGADEVLYDIGANVGVYSLVAALKPGGARVYAFEPSYANVASLCANIVLNGANDRITPLPMALSRETGLRSFGLRSLDAGTARHAGTADYRAGEAPADEAPTIYQQPVLMYRLDDVVAELRLPLPNHVKLDVDGGELAVLEGAQQTLASPALRSMLVEVSASLSAEVTRALAGFGLQLSNRIDVNNRDGQSLVWYGLFTRAGHAGRSADESAATVFSR